MKINKLSSYLGFAARSGNLIGGTETCHRGMEKGRIRLLIITGDMAENTTKKLVQKCTQTDTNYRIFGHSDDLGPAAGKRGCGVLGITDQHFAEIIEQEIDQDRSEREVF